MTKVPTLPAAIVSAGNSASITFSQTTTVKDVWTKDTSDTIPVPAPSSIWYYEDAGASATGNSTYTADDGRGDAATTTVNADGSTTAISTSGYPGKITRVTGSGSYTITYTVTASASTSVAVGATGTVPCSLGAAEVTTVHALPFNLILDPTTPYSVVGRDVHVNYDYWSTSGNIADIASSAINLQESVAYSGGGTTRGGIFTADSPPFIDTHNNPTSVSVPIGGTGGMGQIGAWSVHQGFKLHTLRILTPERRRYSFLMSTLVKWR